MRTKLWSTLLVLVLLCACVAGVLMLSAQAEGNSVQYFVDGESDGSDGLNFKTVQKAMAAAQKKTDWGENDTLTITLKADTTASGTNQLFDVLPIFCDTGKLLSVTIDGTSAKYALDLSATGTSWKNIGCTNNYTFKNLTLPWGDNYVRFLAGIGQVTFDGCTFSGGSNFSLSGGCASMATLRGVSKENYEAMTETGKEGVPVFTSSVTIKNMTVSGNYLVNGRSYNGGFDTSGDTNAAKCGANVTNKNVKSVMILGDGANVGRIKVITCASSQANAYDEIVYRVENGAKFSGMFVYAETGETYGDVSVYLGGTCTANYIRGFNANTTIHGDFSFELDNLRFTTNPSTSYTVAIGAGVDGIVDGNANITVSSGNYSADYPIYGFLRGSCKSFTSNIKGGTVGTFAPVALLSGIQGQVKGKITNNVSGGTVTDFYGCGNDTEIPAADGTSVENKVSGGTITNFYGATKGGAFNGTVTNTVSASAKITNFYGSGENGRAKSTVINQVSGGEITTFYGGAKASQGCGSIANTITGGVFGTYYGGGKAAATISSGITNEISGATFNKTSFMGSVGGNVTGGITNTIKSGTFKGMLYCGSQDSGSGKVEKITTTILGGDFSGNVFGGSKSGVITKKIATTIEGGTFRGTYFYGGNENATFFVDTSDTAETLRIQNDIRGGSFLRIVGGSSAARIDGSVVSNISTDITIGALNAQGTSFTGGAFYGGNANSGVITGTVTNTFNGTQEGKTVATVPVIYGGNNNSTDSIGKIVNKLESGVFCAVYGGNNYGGDAPIENTVTGGVFVADSINTLDEDTNYFCGGNRVADLTSDVKTTVTGGTLLNVYAGTLQGNDSGNVELILLPFERNLTILGKAYGITSSLSKAQNPICIGKDTYLSFAVSDPENYVYVLQTEAWEFDCYVSIPGNENDISYSQAEGVAPGAVYVDYLSEKLILRCGNMANVESASLILTDRIAIKVYFAKGRVYEGFTYSFTGLRGEPLASGTEADLVEEGDYYYAVLPAIGLSDFEKPFLLTGNFLRTEEMSIIGLADLGAKYYDGKDEKAANLFRSIADLGRSANAGVAENGLTSETVVYTPAEPTVKAGTDVLDMKTMTLVMSNAVGISLKGVAAAPDTAFDIYVDGQKVTELCGITVSTQKNGSGTYDVTVDLYLNVSAMSKEIKIELKDGDTTYLAMYTRADYLAQQIVNRNAEGKDLAEDLLVYIQAVDAYKA